MKEHEIYPHYYDVPLVTGCMGGVTGYDVGKTRYDAQFC